MVDAIVDAIRMGEINAGNISFTLLRNVAGRDCGCWDELGRGRAILRSTEQLDQYLYSYGPMTESQWDQFLSDLTMPAERIRIVDYGCGQGLASALLFDNFGPELVERVGTVVLIEPSSVALTRAKAVLECYCENCRILDVNKDLDGLTPEELSSNGEPISLHLFSNVLDIEGFHHFQLFTKMFQTKGRHSVLAVSHDRVLPRRGHEISGT